MKINAVIEDKISHREKIFSQNNCESNVLNIYRISSLGFKELILKRASSYYKIVEKTLRAWCGLVMLGIPAECDIPYGQL